MFKILPQKVFFCLIFFLLAISIGSIIFLNNLFNAHTSFLKLSSIIPLTSAPSSISLNLTSPDDNLMTFESDILIDGQTTPNATVLISVEDSDKVIESNNKGYFSYTAHLTEGINQFNITAFDSVGNSRSEFRSVYYSKEKI